MARPRKTETPDFSDKVGRKESTADLKAKIATQDTLIKQLELDLQGAKKRLEAREAEISGLEVSNHDLSESNTKLKQEIAEYQAVNADMHSETLEGDAALQDALKRIEELNEECHNYQTQVDEKTSLIANLTKRVEELVAEMKKKDNTIDDLQEELLSVSLKERSLTQELDETYAALGGVKRSDEELLAEIGRRGWHGELTLTKTV